MRSFISAVAFAAADLASGPAPTVATEAKPEFNAGSATSNVKPVAAPKRVRTIKAKPGKAAAKPSADKPTKPTKPEAAKPVEIHGLANSYRGASPVFRGHARKLSVIVLGRVAGTYTDRDHAALKAVFAKFGTKPFPAYDTDRGVISRLAAHGLISHVSGELSLRDCRFAVTALAVKTKLKTAAAPKA